MYTLIYEPCHEKTCFSHVRTTKVQISLRIRASDQHLCCSLLRQYNTSSFYIQNFKTLASFCGCTARFESQLVGNPSDRFSRDVAHILLLSLQRNLQGSRQDKSIQILFFLIEKGASLDVKNNKNQTPLDLVKDKHIRDMIVR